MVLVEHLIKKNHNCYTTNSEDRDQIKLIMQYYFDHDLQCLNMAELLKTYPTIRLSEYSECQTGNNEHVGLPLGDLNW